MPIRELRPPARISPEHPQKSPSPPPPAALVEVTLHVRAPRSSSRLLRRHHAGVSACRLTGSGRCLNDQSRVKGERNACGKHFTDRPETGLPVSRLSGAGAHRPSQRLLRLLAPRSRRWKHRAATRFHAVWRSLRRSGARCSPDGRGSPGDGDNRRLPALPRGRALLVCGAGDRLSRADPGVSPRLSDLGLGVRAFNASL